MVSLSEIIGIFLFVCGMWTILWAVEANKAAEQYKEDCYQMSEDARRKSHAEEDKLLKFDIES